ncbi:hypothetical protein GKE82_16720 [Conexibacter sp. W3-3-2]|uniref:hypothetical protein n=1 Tax=Conexibacter sp. W3-3-2 TaxID=2675227 RepID=UPI0012B9F134|nr:hypothetical protein [Conexibacter sp. W3-3-2]MTD45885.1 hypothetical protein [Conexibacter sp. W3-3-2]
MQPLDGDVERHRVAGERQRRAAQRLGVADVQARDLAVVEVVADEVDPVDDVEHSGRADVLAADRDQPPELPGGPGPPRVDHRGDPLRGQRQHEEVRLAHVGCGADVVQQVVGGGEALDRAHGASLCDAGAPAYRRGRQDRGTDASARAMLARRRWVAPRTPAR